MSNDTHPTREAWPLIWLGAVICSIWMVGNEKAEPVVRWLMTACMWAGLWYWHRQSAPHWQPKPEPLHQDPYMQGALHGGVIALVVSALMFWMFPELSRPLPPDLADVEETGRVPIAAIVAMMAVYMSARMHRIQSLEKNGFRSDGVGER